MSVLVNQSKTYWVLGHSINLLAVTEGYSIVEIVALANDHGPPPHIHHDCSELFLVLEGELELIAGADRIKLTAGQSAIVEPHTLHTFANNTQSSVRMLTILSPSGFEKYFQDMGIPDDVPGAQIESTQPAFLERAVKEAPRYHLEFPMPEVSM